MRRFLLEAGLPEEAVDRRVSGYSKGMRQKVRIAIAVAKKARFEERISSRQAVVEKLKYLSPAVLIL